MKLSSLSIRSKALLATLGISALGIMSVGLLLLSKHMSTTRERAREDVEVMASTLSGFASAPLVFEDEVGARSILEGLRSHANVASAALFDAQGQLFSHYSPNGAVPPSYRAQDWSGIDARGQLVAYRVVRHQGQRLGVLYLASSTDDVERALAQDFRSVALVCLALILLCGVLAYHLQALVTRPLRSLADAMRSISEGGDLTLRVRHGARDELGTLYDCFNNMLDEVQSRGEARDRIRTRLETLLQALPDLVFILDEDGYCLEAWTGSKPALLSRPEDYVRKHVRDLLPPDVAQAIVDAVRRALDSGSSQRLEYEAPLAPDPRNYESVAIPLVDSQLGPRAVLYVARDVSERKQLEAQVREAQRMEAIGRLAGGVAHDFNNLLTGIVGYTEIAMLSCGPRPELSQVLDICQRAADLVSQLLAFSRRRQVSPTPVDLNQIVKQVADLSTRTVGPQIRVEFAADADPCMVAADASQLESAILNLAVNARDAMPDGGVLHFSTRIVPAAGNPQPGLLPGDCIELTVRDTGQGIAPDLKARIWEPFFTTKAAGRGTGLGLAAVYGTVHSHGGHIELESEVGVGSVFRIYLPRIHASAPARERSEELAPTGRGHLLVVDDEEMVRDTATRMLESLGYTAAAFASGAEAVAYYRDHAHEVAATILDLVMPDMNGAETAARLKGIRPDALILIASGYNPLDADALGRIGAAAFMPKPYSRRELAQRLHVLLHTEELERSAG